MKKLKAADYRDSWSCPTEATEKKHFPPRGEFHNWNFLRGIGPSAPELIADSSSNLPTPNRTTGKAFKPGWKSKRRCDPEKERTEHAVQKEIAREKRDAVRKEAMEKQHRYNTFNPITGQEYDGRQGEWVDFVDGWAHQGLTIKPVRQAALSDEEVAQRQERALAIRTMRKERMANDGLVTTERAAGSVKEIMDWGN
ncbi:hypothetical protein BSKO_08091 [Bryopsis sp. KO-2023]|nr:hypothetical protein BSKO_08091 [Bryopsis sp. KO-2023]